MTFRDLVPYAPFITIFGPIIGALIGAAVTYIYVIKRAAVTFTISPSEDLLAPLRDAHKVVEVRANEKEINKLNRGGGIVRNTGNTAIRDLTFEVLISGDHGFHMAYLKAPNRRFITELSETATYTIKRGDGTPIISVELAVDFLNPKEQFEFAVLFDGATDDIQVECRMPDLKCKIKRIPNQEFQIGVP